MKELVESQDELSGGCWLAAREAAVGGQDQAPVVMAVGNAAVVDGDEVTLVVCHERTILGLRPGKEIFICSAAQIGALCDRDDIVIAVAKLLSDRGRIHLVERQLQASAACSRRHAASAASASSSLCAIHMSISAE